MKKLVVLLGAILLASPVLAQDFPTNSDNRGQIDNPSAFRVNRAFGEYIGLAQVADATHSAVDFGFEADYVQICMEDDSARSYIRFGTTLPTNATSSANFISGVTGSLRGQAMPLFGSGDGTDVNCIAGPFATNGVIIHSAGNASVDVRAYAE